MVSLQLIINLIHRNVMVTLGGVLLIGVILILTSIGCIRYNHSESLSFPAEPRWDDFYSHNNRGLAYLGKQEYDHAIQEFQMASEIFPESPTAYLNLGITYLKQGKWGLAEKKIKQALIRSPNDPNAYFLMALIYGKEGQIEEQKKAYEQVTKHDLNDIHTRYTLANLFAYEEQFQEAIQLLKEISKLEPESLPVFLLLGEYLILDGQTKEAVQFYDRVAAMSQEKSEELLTYLNFGKNHIKHNRLKEGLRDLRIFANLHKELPQYQKSLEILKTPRYGKVQEYLAGVDDPMDLIEENVSVLFHQTSAGLRSETPAQRISEGVGKPDSFLVREDYDPDMIKKTIAPGYASGACLGDYNSDGLLDLYLVQSGQNTLYRNNRDGTFTEYTGLITLTHSSPSTNCVFGDYDSDGDLDLYVTAVGSNVLYRNDGDHDLNGWAFVDVTDGAGVGDAHWSTSAIFLDYDLDGDLDLYVTNYVDLDHRPSHSPFLFPDDLFGTENRLYRNNGDRTFTDVTSETDVGGELGKSLIAKFVDVDNDRDPDLLVSDENESVRLFINRPDEGVFDEVTGQMTLRSGEGSRGISAGDYNGDGYMDLLIALNSREIAILYQNNGDGSFSVDQNFAQKVITLAGEYGVAAEFMDYDNDGLLDILVVTTGIGKGQRGLNQEVLIYRNKGNGEFLDGPLKLSSTRVDSGRGLKVTISDYDSDGDADIFLMKPGVKPVWYRNEGGNQNHWVNIKTYANRCSNKSGVGSRVEIRSGRLWLYGWQTGHGVRFGLGKRTSIDFVRVFWPSGIDQIKVDIPINRSVTITEKEVKVWGASAC